MARADRRRRPGAAHRLVIEPGRPAWSLFLTGPKVREWGFHCPQGWRPWRAFTAGAHGAEIGAGCDG